MKIAVIGAGHVGATTASMLAQRNLADIVLLDIADGLAQGKGLDMSESGPVLRFESRVKGTQDYADISGAQIVVITAGLPRTPGMSRMDLLQKNSRIVAGITREVVQAAPQAIIIVVTNPLDVMTYIAWKISGFARHRVMGMAGVLDSSRLCYFMAEALNVSVEDTHAMVLGGHADSMVPLVRCASVSGIPLTQLLPEDEIKKLIDRTRGGGTEIVNLLKSGSAYYAAGASITKMVEAIVLDSRRLLSASVYLDGEFGISGVFLGVPIVLGRQGVERILEINLTERELADLKFSADGVKKGIMAWEELNGQA